MDLPRPWCRMTAVDPDGRVTERQLLEGSGPPGLDAIDEVARRALAAARAGGRLVLDEVSPQMGDLLRLVGLGVEVGREAVRGEQPLGIKQIEEKGHLDDLSP
jgi:hypothetical protein